MSQKQQEEKGCNGFNMGAGLDYSRSNFHIELKNFIRLAKMVDDFEELKHAAYQMEARLKEAGWI